MGKKSFGVSFSIHPNIKFSREAKQNMALPFLDVLVRKTTDGLLKHTVYLHRWLSTFTQDLNTIHHRSVLC
jgi:hypothetical protein